MFSWYVGGLCNSKWRKTKQNPTKTNPKPHTKQTKTNRNQKTTLETFLLKEKIKITQHYNIPVSHLRSEMVVKTLVKMSEFSTEIWVVLALQKKLSNLQKNPNVICNHLGINISVSFT